MSGDEPDPDAMPNLRRLTADRLRAARGDRAAIVAAIEQFLDGGMEIVDSPSAMWHYFAISSPTIPQMAGYDEAAEDRIVRIFSTVTHERFDDSRPLPPEWPWHEREEAD